MTQDISCVESCGVKIRKKLTSYYYVTEGYASQEGSSSAQNGTYCKTAL